MDSGGRSGVGGDGGQQPTGLAVIVLLPRGPPKGPARGKGEVNSGHGESGPSRPSDVNFRLKVAVTARGSGALG